MVAGLDLSTIDEDDGVLLTGFSMSLSKSIISSFLLGLDGAAVGSSSSLLISIASWIFELEGRAPWAVAAELGRGCDEGPRAASD